MGKRFVFPQNLHPSVFPCSVMVGEDSAGVNVEITTIKRHKMCHEHCLVAFMKNTFSKLYVNRFCIWAYKDQSFVVSALWISANMTTSLQESFSSEEVHLRCFFTEKTYKCCFLNLLAGSRLWFEDIRHLWVKIRVWILTFVDCSKLAFHPFSLSLSWMIKH